jgi:hypothetical protein
LLNEAAAVLLDRPFQLRLETFLGGVDVCEAVHDGLGRDGEKAEEEDEQNVIPSKILDCTLTSPMSTATEPAFLDMPIRAALGLLLGREKKVSEQAGEKGKDHLRELAVHLALLRTLLEDTNV